MSLYKIARGSHWMSEDELQRVRSVVLGLKKCFKAVGVVETPLLELRVEDLVISYLLARRLEEQLAYVEAAPVEKGMPSLSNVTESIGKARERMRKAMKELEESCVKLGTPIDVGLADKMQPILEQARGVEAASLEDTEDMEP